jgi:hypothetical protein
MKQRLQITTKTTVKQQPLSAMVSRAESLNLLKQQQLVTTQKPKV